MKHPALPPLLALMVALTTAPSASASQAEARDVARGANCPPGKIEVVSTIPGTAAQTIYRIACTGQKDVAVMVRCVARLCTLMRPEKTEKK